MRDFSKLAKKKVLAVEDDQFFANLLAQKLSSKEAIVLVAGDGLQAFEILQKEVPHLILLDLLLPGEMDGFEILRRVKADDKYKSIPVVILSNLGQPEDVEKGMKLGAFHYLVKASTSPDEILDHAIMALESAK